MQTAQIYSSKATYYKVIKRWEKYVEEGGSTQNKVENIYVIQFRHHRTQLKVTIHNAVLAFWQWTTHLKLTFPISKQVHILSSVSKVYIKQKIAK